MKEIKLFWKMMKGSRFIYFISMLSTIFIQIFSGITPIIIMVSVDSIIGDKPFKYEILKTACDYIGGRDFLRSHIYIGIINCIFYRY